MSNISLTYKIKKFFIEKKWGLLAILIGTAAGLLSAVICIRWNIAIFGFNISFIISPLIAGYVETLIAREKYGKTTGAISALLIFLIININSWVFPEDPLTLNFFTLGGLALAFQAAFPILVNYLLFVVFLGTITYVIGYIGNILSKITYKLTAKSSDDKFAEKKYAISSTINLDEMDVIAVTTSNIENKLITKNLGLISGTYIFKPNLKFINGNNEKENGKKDYSDIFDQMELARNHALADLMKNTQKLGANGVLEIEIEYTDIGGIKGNEIMVSVSGSAVVLESK